MFRKKYYPYLRTIGSANFCTPYNNKVYTLKGLNGRLLSYGKASDDNGYYVPVTFEFDNKGDIIPRLICRDIPALLAYGERYFTPSYGSDRGTRQLLRIPASG